MTEKQYNLAKTLKSDIARHESNLQTLRNYLENIAINRNAVLEYFSVCPLYDVSLSLDIDILLKQRIEKEIEACEKIINLKKKDFSEL